MTLNTSVVIGAPVDPETVYRYCRALLNTPDTVEPVHYERQKGRPNASIDNPPGVGLAAWLMVHHRDGEPMAHLHDEWCATEVGPAKWDEDGKVMVTQEEVDEHTEWVAGEPSENGWGYIEVTFDTSYGFRGEGGESCSDLHARLVTALGGWLDAQGLPWKWQNEYTCEWFDRFDKLAEFGNAHKSTGADAWFRNVVLPAIALGVASPGGES